MRRLQLGYHEYQQAADVVQPGLLGATGSAMTGGDIKAGFLSSAFSALVTPQVECIHAGDRSGGAVAARVAVSAIIGGTASVLAGGKFGNGVVTAAFGRAFNGEGVQKNNLAGSSFDGDVGDMYERAGFETHRQVRVSTSSGKIAVLDYIIETPDGYVMAECKSGCHAKLSTGQKAVFESIRRGEAVTILSRNKALATGMKINFVGGVLISNSSEGRALRQVMRRGGIRAVGSVGVGAVLVLAPTAVNAATAPAGEYGWAEFFTDVLGAVTGSVPAY